MEHEDKTTENRLLAAITHFSVIVQGTGILVGIFIYVSQREKTRYVAFQALQAAAYQLITFVITIVLWLLWGILYGLSMIPLIMQAETNPDAAPPAIFWISMILMVVPLFYMIITGLYGLWGGLRAWQGKDFKYLLIGNWLEKRGFWRKAASLEQA